MQIEADTPLSFPAFAEIYTSALGLSPLIDTLFARLRRKVDEELEFQKELTQVRGALDMIFACSQA